MRTVLLLLAGLGFVAIGLWMAGVLGEGPDPTDRPGRIPPELVPYVGWLGVIFFGICLPFVAKRLFENNPQIEIGSAGIKFAPWSDTTIPWHEIDRVSVWSYKRQRHIILHLHRPDAFPGRGIAGKLSGANRMLTGGDVAVSLNGTDGNFNDAMAAIAHFGGHALFD